MARLRLRSTRPERKSAPRVHAEPQLSVAPQKVEHVGLILREGREHFGAALRDVASALRIRHVYLQAIEDGRFDDLPGPTYAMGFVRAYSDFLGFDTDALLERYKAETRGLERTQELDFPAAPTEGRFPGGGALLASLVIAGAAFGGWYYMQNQDNFGFESMPAIIVDTLGGRFGGDETPQATVPMRGTPAEGAVDEFATVNGLGQGAPALAALPEPEPAFAVEPAPEIAAVVPAPDPAAAEATPEPAAEPNPPLAIESPPAAVAELPRAPARLAAEAEIEIAAVPATPEADLALPAADDPIAPEIDIAAPEVAEPTPPIDLAAAPEVEIATLPEGPAAPAEAQLPAVPRTATNAAAGRVYGMTNQDSRIVIIAEVDSWIQVRDASRADVVTRMLRAGDSYRVPNESGLILMSGNAGGLKIALDGEDARTLGAAGEVVRDVPLDPDTLRSRYLQ